MSTAAILRGAERTGRRRWLGLAFVSLAQLMIALDATVMNVALPSAQSALRFSDADRQWVITGYTLAFGGLLLLGGRVADYAGRKRAFVVSLIGFAAASALGGAAPDLGVLVTARALQGGFAALLAPTVLSLLTVTFTAPADRARAFAVFGAVAGGGGALGLVLGGALADANWRWCLYINLPVAIVAIAGGTALLDDVRPPGRVRLDVPGALLATAGLVALVYGCAQAASHGWTSARVAGPLVAGVLLLATFAVVQTRVAAPLLPLRIVGDRNRVGAYLAVASAVAGMLGVFLFLTYYLQVFLGYRPLRAGLAFLPLSAAVLVSAQLAGRLLPHRRPRTLIVPGLVTAAVAMLLLTTLNSASGYAGRVLPAEVLLGLGIGWVFVPAMNAATQRVDPRDGGVAAAVVNTSQQIGGSLGVAVLNTTAAAATAGYARSRPHAEALIHGYTVAAAWAAALLLAGAVLAAVLVTARPNLHGSEGAGHA
ncbi:MFS transporter [Micromonospora yasonensis]|uniref:MFS transporter n=1 Tax=Micromonospora yasonensis TaxID=1128667 RepID=UPI002230272A|nr:MFS transporter [Micromonospora yasonensis]MCW3841614.1 MFS transporter [Micromonospora yasonensis]